MIERMELVVVGRVSGLLGTDSMKRDIYSGVVAGMKWALLIGLLTSVISVLVGVLYGIIAAYFGGPGGFGPDAVFDFFISMPVLPILIVFSAIYQAEHLDHHPGPDPLLLGRPVKTVRSMALQIKEETFIEAAKALGSGHVADHLPAHGAHS